MIVADTNVIAYLYINSDKSKHSAALARQDSDWAVPLLWSSEFRNVLSLYLKQGLMQIEEALRIIKAAETLLAKKEYKIVSTDVIKLASQSNCSAYDCEFVALAQKLDIKLVTSDKKVLKAFPEVAVSLETYTYAEDEKHSE